jgi:hypothetical protein
MYYFIILVRKLDMMTRRRIEYWENYMEEHKSKYRLPPEKDPDPVPELLNPNYAYMECSPSVKYFNLVFYERQI